MPFLWMLENVNIELFFFLSASVYLIYTSFSLEFFFMMSRRRVNSFLGDLTIFHRDLFLGVR